MGLLCRNLTGLPLNGAMSSNFASFSHITELYVRVVLHSIQKKTEALLERCYLYGGSVYANLLYLIRSCIKIQRQLGAHVAMSGYNPDQVFVGLSPPFQLLSRHTAEDCSRFRYTNPFSLLPYGNSQDTERLRPNQQCGRFVVSRLHFASSVRTFDGSPCTWISCSGSEHAVTYLFCWNNLSFELIGSRKGLRHAAVAWPPSERDLFSASSSLGLGSGPDFLSPHHVFSLPLRLFRNVSHNTLSGSPNVAALNALTGLHVNFCLNLGCPLFLSSFPHLYCI